MEGLQVLLSELTRLYESENQTSYECFETAARVLPGGNTRSVLYSSPFPLFFTGGQGCYLSSVDGSTYLDFVSEYSAGIYGHSHPAIMQAIVEALKGGINLGGHNQLEAELARLIVERFHSIEMVRFTNSGTEASLMAISAAKAYTGREKVCLCAISFLTRSKLTCKQIMVFSNGYHGGGLSFSTLSNPASNIPHDFVVAPFNDVEGACAMVSESLAAIIVEPVQGAGGAIPASEEFLRGMKQCANQVGAVFILDEVMSSRLSPRGMQGLYNITPDLTVLGKYLGGGMSFGCVGGHTKIMAKFDPRLGKTALPHSGTFNNNVLSMAAGIAGFKILTPEVIVRMNNLGDRLRGGLVAVLATYRVHKLSITGFGSLIGLHFTGEGAADLLSCLFYTMLQSRIYIGRRGFVCLNIIHDETHVSEFLAALEVFIDRFRAYLV